MATKKAGGSTRNGRDSEAKRLGVKMYGGQTVKSRKHYRASARYRIPPWS